MPDWDSIAPAPDKPKAKSRWDEIAPSESSGYDASKDPLLGAALPAQAGRFAEIGNGPETVGSPAGRGGGGTSVTVENAPKRLGSTETGQVVYRTPERQDELASRRKTRETYMKVTQGFGGLLDEEGVRGFVENDKNTEQSKEGLDRIYAQQEHPLLMAHALKAHQDASLGLLDFSSPLQRYVAERRAAEGTSGERLGLMATGTLASLPAIAVGGEVFGIPATLGIQGAANTEGDVVDKALGFVKGAVVGKSMGVVGDRFNAFLSAMPKVAANRMLQRLASYGSGAAALTAVNQAAALAEGKGIDPEAVWHDMLLGTGISVVGGVSGRYVHPVDVAKARQAAARGERATRQSTESLSAENEMLAGSIPDTGVTPHDTLRAASDQAEAVLGAAEGARAGAVAENKAALARRRGIAAFAGRAVDQGVGSTDTGPRLADVVKQRFPDATDAEIRQTVVDLHEAGKIDTARAASEFGLQWEPATGPRPNRGMQGKRPMYVKKGEPVETPKPPMPWDLLTREQPFVGVNPDVAARRAAAAAAGTVEVPYGAPKAEIDLAGAPQSGEIGKGGPATRPIERGVLPDYGQRWQDPRTPEEFDRSIATARGYTTQKGATSEDSQWGEFADKLEAEKARRFPADLRPVGAKNAQPSADEVTLYHLTERGNEEGIRNRGFTTRTVYLTAKDDIPMWAAHLGLKDPVAIPVRVKRNAVDTGLGVIRGEQVVEGEKLPIHAREYWAKSADVRVDSTMRPVGGTPPEGPTGESQRGAVGGSDGTDARGRLAQAVDDLVKLGVRSKRWVTSRILRPAFDADADSAALIARGAGIPQGSKTQAAKMVDDAAPGWSAKDRTRLFLAYSEAQHNRQGDTLADTKAFKRAFPKPGDFETFRDSDVYKDAAKALRAQFDKHVRPINERAGAKGDISALEGPNGEFSNLIPLDEDAADRIPGRASGSLGQPRGLTGPSVPRSINAKQRVGGASVYDWNVENQFARALARNGDIANRLDVIDSMVRNGSAIKTTDAEGNPVDKPEGWVPFRPLLGKGMEVGPDGDKGMPSYYIKPEFASPLRARFQQNLIPEEGGLGSKVKQAGVFSQLFVNPAAGAFHIGLNVFPAVLRDATVGRALAFPLKALYYAARPKAAADAVLAQADVGGVREQHTKSTVPYLGKLSDVAGRIVDGFDIAGREAVLDTVKAKQAKGEVPNDVQAQHEALLKFGNYQRLLQDATTKAFRFYSNPFTVIAKAAIDNAHTTLGLAQGFEANTRTARLKQAAKVAALFGSYFGYNAIANQKDTGEFFPDGIPAGSRWKGVDDKTGKPLYSWGVIGTLLGAERVLGWTPAAAIDPARRGEGAGNVLAAPIAALGHDVGHVIGYFPRTVDRITQEMKAGDWGKAVQEFPVVKEVISLLNGKDIGDSLFPGFGAKKGLSEEELMKRKGIK